MTIPIQVTSTDPTRYVTATSRYANSTVIIYGEDGIITFNTYKKHSFPSSQSDKFDVVPPGEEFRPDKTSQRAYGTVDFWWRILEANNIKDIYDYTAGTNIRVPSALSIF